MPEPIVKNVDRKYTEGFTGMSRSLLHVDLPTIITDDFTPEMTETYMYFNSIEVTEIDSGVSGPTKCYIDGLHGEEYQEPTISQTINRLLQEADGQLLKGKIIEVDRLNVPGSRDGTRYLHPSESSSANTPFTSLNDIFHLYRDGSLEELQLINKTHQSPTALYGWLFASWIMNEVVTKASDPQNITLKDYHSDDRYTFPYYPVDRMFEKGVRPSLEQIEGLYEMARDTQIATIFDFPSLAEENSEALSSSLNRLGVRSLTLERGPTHKPNSNAVTYVALQEMKQMLKEEMISVNREKWDHLVMEIEAEAQKDPLIQAAKHMWELTYQQGKLFALDERKPLIRQKDGTIITAPGVLEKLITEGSFDGSFYLHYLPDIFGVEGAHQEVPIATMSLSPHEPSPETSYLLSVEKLDTDEHIISLAEDVHDHTSGAVKCGLQYSKGDNKIELWIYDGTKDDVDTLSPVQIATLLDQGADVDFSYFVNLAVPDPIYKGRIDEQGKLRIEERPTESVKTIRSDE